MRYFVIYALMIIMPFSAVAEEKTSLSEGEIDSYLASHKLNELYVNLGPITLKKGVFWDDVNNPKVWLDVKMIVIPSITELNKHGSIKIDYVLNKKGHNIYNKDHRQEVDFHTSLALQKQNSPFEHLSAIRSINLIKGAKKGDVASIKGTLILNIPVNVEIIPFMIKELNIEKIAKNGSKVILTGIEGNNVKLKYTGKKDTVPKVKAYDKDGKEIKSKNGTSWRTSGNITEYNMKYDTFPSIIKFHSAEKLVKKEYPFVMGKEYKK